MYLEVVRSSELQSARRIEVRDGSVKLYTGAENAWMLVGELRWENGESVWEYANYSFLSRAAYYTGRGAIEQFEVEADQSFLSGRISDL